MYICLDCGRIFEIPRKHIETHGLDSPPYEMGAHFVAVLMLKHLNVMDVENG